MFEDFSLLSFHIKFHMGSATTKEHRSSRVNLTNYLAIQNGRPFLIIGQVLWGLCGKILIIFK